jgi:hypothetical protein
MKTQQSNNNNNSIFVLAMAEKMRIAAQNAKPNKPEAEKYNKQNKQKAEH